MVGAVHPRSGAIDVAVADGLVYFRDNLSMYISPVQCEYSSAVLIDVPESASMIAKIYPNPFNPQSTIDFNIAARSKVELAIYDVHGRRVESLVDGYLPAGPHSMHWDGRCAAGHRVASGQYFVRLKSDEGVDIRKVTLIK